MNKKWKVRRGFIKMHIAVDIKNKKIIALEITREDVHDNKKFKDLIDNIDAKIDKVIVDGAYDSNDNFNYLTDKGIEPVIRVRSNSIINNSIRDMHVLDQLSDYTRWKHKHDYGKRWIAESVFSSFKRMFGEYIKSVRWDNMVKELMVKITLGIFALYWAYSITKDYNEHINNHKVIDNDIIDALSRIAKL
ncbi:MAG: hypothetical protein KatS3mg003_1293 [Candidatus Nitrosocaldaceae archaeon]|nr:MAG: hypothetical protein KatS3mg003_1293 [Candidatus Nitrosocaldaceae archaeon]